MLPITVLFLGGLMVLMAGVFCVMFADVAFRPQPAAAEAGNAKRWQPPVNENGSLKLWAGETAAVTAKRFLRNAAGKVAPGRMMAMVREGVSAAVQQVAERQSQVANHKCEQDRAVAIGVTAPEALAIADELRQHGAGEADQVLRRLAGVAAGEPMLCPLLGVDGRCLTFGSRPLACRGNCGSCQGGCYTRDDQAEAIAQGAEVGLSKALAEAGLDGRVYELNGALQVALQQSDAADQWAAGKDVFADCRTLA
ncbi:MAG: hypothetical protein KDA59_00130 [Planctomycetales bacterium]|nr:hypothetical protein [Planctomycetales bacterium]